MTVTVSLRTLIVTLILVSFVSLLLISFFIGSKTIEESNCKIQTMEHCLKDGYSPVACSRYADNKCISIDQ